MKISPLERFQAKVRPAPSGCWEWAGARDKVSGYGRFHLLGKCVYAHRFAYEALVGPIPDGLTIDHLCRNRACVNPVHLQPVTMAVNTHRAAGSIAARNAAKRECDNGHEFTPENTYIDPRGCRICKTCRRANRLAFEARERAAREQIRQKAA